MTISKNLDSIDMMCMSTLRVAYVSLGECPNSLLFLSYIFCTSLNDLVSLYSDEICMKH